MKKLSLVLVFVLLLISIAPVALAKGSYLGQKTVVNCNEWVTLRAKPSTGAKSVAKVPLGATVDAYYYNTEFSECYYLGMHGYILTTYLSGSNTTYYDDHLEYLGTKYVVNCNEFVTLREYASTKAPAVTRVAKGMAVDAYYYNGTFCYCYYNGLEGYILSKYLGDYPQYTYRRGDYMGYMSVVNCDSWVTLRARPSTSANAVTRVPLGDVVEAYYYNSTFAECYYSGLHGYILLSYLY